MTLKINKYTSHKIKSLQIDIVQIMHSKNKAVIIYGFAHK